MFNVLLVATGGAFGAVMRHLAGRGWLKVFGPAHPWGATFVVNVLGGLLMGLLIGALALRSDGGERARLLLGVGVLGGFTTFSSFALEAVMMIERKAYGVAALYIVGSCLLSILGVMAGLMLMRRFA
jgi:CrcB protein